MRRLARRSLILLLAVNMFALIAVNASAVGTISYVGDTEKFVFSADSNQHPTNLFSEFQNVMPGDVLKEQITVRNDAKNGVKIKLYLRSFGAQAGTEDFLSKLKLSVAQKDGSELFSAPASETAGLTDWTYLGTVYSGGEVKLEVTLKVPVELDNSYQNMAGYLDWEFMAEELPVEETDPDLPATSDTLYFVHYLMLFGVSVLSIVLLMTKKCMWSRQSQPNNCGE